MRKGALDRFSLVVVLLSLLSIVPVAYWHYKSTAPSYYECTDSTNTTDELSCYPRFPADVFIPSTESYLYCDYSYIERPVGYSPRLHISETYLRRHYKHIVEHQGGRVVLMANEKSELDEVIKNESLLLKPIEDRYKDDTLGFAITYCLILPLLTLALLYVLRFFKNFILYGSSKAKLEKETLVK